MINPHLSINIFENLLPDEEYSCFDSDTNELLLDFYDKNKELYLDKTSFYSLLCHYIQDLNFHMENQDKIINNIFVELMIIHYSTYEELIESTYILNEYCKNIVFKEKLFDYLYHKAYKPSDYIKLFYLHYRMFKKSTINQTIQRMILKDSRINLSDSFDMLCLCVSYKIISQNTKAEYFKIKAINILKNLDVKSISNIVHNFRAFYENFYQVSFINGDWYSRLNTELIMILLNHIDYKLYKKQSIFISNKLLTIIKQ